MEVFRLIDNLKGVGLSVNSVCITLFENQPSAKKFATKLKAHGEKVYFHQPIENYPNDLEFIVSDNGYGKNPYIETKKPLVVVAAPGPGSCKMATCLGQMYHENKKGIRSGYAKFETFPVWDLPINHPVNVAYEAATSDLEDVNMIDPYHKSAYGKSVVNYNRDIEAYPVLRDILKKITGEVFYKSPTDMGVNRVAKCIIDDEACKEAGRQEIIRRYLKNKVELKKGTTSLSTVERNLQLMKKCNLKVDNREVSKIAHLFKKETGSHVVAIELNDDRVVIGKNKGIITATAGAVLNALKELAQIPHDNIVDHVAVRNIVELKQNLKIGNNLDLKDIFIALSILSDYDENSKLALDQISNLKGCEVHSTFILPRADEDFLRKLKVNLTCDDEFVNNNLFE
jgi:uncharacterized protein (UPF0371 family)